jgi:hypothetical protein
LRYCSFQDLIRQDVEEPWFAKYKSNLTSLACFVTSMQSSHEYQDVELKDLL